MSAAAVRFLGVTPYLHYEDAAAALDWLARICGFDEIARYLDAEGIVREAEMRIGDQEVWLSGGGPGYWQRKGYRPDALIIVWVDDVDSHHARAVAGGAAAEPPEDKPYAVRTYTLTDPEGYRWGFMQRLDEDVQLQAGWREVKPDGSVRSGPVT
jgi:uncharacterized glyoxalase superfamily protein PhnB